MRCAKLRHAAISRAATADEMGMRMSVVPCFIQRVFLRCDFSSGGCHGSATPARSHAIVLLQFLRCRDAGNRKEIDLGMVTADVPAPLRSTPLASCCCCVSFLPALSRSQIDSHFAELASEQQPRPARLSSCCCRLCRCHLFRRCPFLGRPSSCPRTSAQPLFWIPSPLGRWTRCLRADSRTGSSSACGSFGSGNVGQRALLRPT